jgi:HD-GYP domain-containing protein (c-di-GMP phosphodiesterase class II)
MRTRALGIIDRLGFLQDAVPAIRHHHERFDGTGYPDGIAGEEIPLGARIIHVADALDSMLTTRIYRAARPADEALERASAAAPAHSSARAASRRSSACCRPRSTASTEPPSKLIATG